MADFSLEVFPQSDLPEGQALFDVLEGKFKPKWGYVGQS